MDNRSKTRDTHGERGGRNWFRGESSRHRQRDAQGASVPPSRDRSSPEERRALRQLWQCKGSPPSSADSYESVHQALDDKELFGSTSDATVIYPEQFNFSKQSQFQNTQIGNHSVAASGIITINPSANTVHMFGRSPLQGLMQNGLEVSGERVSEKFLGVVEENNQIADTPANKLSITSGVQDDGPANGPVDGHCASITPLLGSPNQMQHDGAPDQ
jgi:hypothetical protein